MSEECSDPRTGYSFRAAPLQTEHLRQATFYRRLSTSSSVFVKDGSLLRRWKTKVGRTSERGCEKSTLKFIII